MKKAKKIKIAIISAVIAVVLIASGLLTYFLIFKTENDSKLKELLRNVSGQIFASYDDLAKSYNDESTAQTIALKGTNSKTTVLLLASPVAAENDDLWNTTEGTETFQSYLDNINNVMAHYAISEYLVENSEKLDFNKTYHFQSSTVEYYATAEYTDKYFSFTLHNDNEDICIKINIADKGNKGKAIEFYKESKTSDSKYYYQYSTLNFENNTYEEITLLSKNKYNGNLNNEWIDDNIEEHKEHKMNHKDKDSYNGKNHKRNDKSANHHNDPKTQGMKDKVSQHKDKLFGTFESKNPDKNNTKEFPNPQGLQNYAFNKYVATLMTDMDGKEFLYITRKSNMIDKAEDLFTTYNFSGQTYSWEYKPEYEVVYQIFFNKVINKNTRSINTDDFKDSQSGKIEFMVKKNGEYFIFNRFSISFDSSETIENENINLISFSISQQESKTIVSLTIQSSIELIKLGYNVSNKSFSGVGQNKSILSGESEILSLDVELNLSSRTIEFTEKNNYKVYIYYYYNSKLMCESITIPNL